MNNPATQILVTTQGTLAIFKVVGRATFARAGDFQAAAHSLQERGLVHFAVDLSGCETMDSTFIGVLAQLVRRLRGLAQGGVTLAGLTPRVQGQIQTLGILDLFQVAATVAPAGAGFQAVAADAASKLELTATALAAHQSLGEANPENILRFKDVTEFLAEELKQLRDGQETA